ncbi:MAG: hypothetical protein ABL960_07830 [Nitrospira sp.]
MRAQSVGRDIKIWGGLFLIVGTMDLIIIVLFPAYALKLFGATVTGPSSFLIKLHSPAVHLLIGYGFLWLRPWAWGLSLAYAGFGIVSETMNQLAFGFHIVRSAFIATTILFALYLIWRRRVFVDEPMSDNKPKRASQELL